MDSISPTIKLNRRKKMLVWLIIVLASAIFQFIAVLPDFPENYICLSPVFTIIALLGMICRVYHKQKAHLREKMEEAF